LNPVSLGSSLTPPKANCWKKRAKVCVDGLSAAICAADSQFGGTAG
jgi:hypothetical protein